MLSSWLFFRFSFVFSFLLCLLMFFTFIACINPKKTGVVNFHDEIPLICDEGRGLKQKKVIAVHSENQMREHYGLTFKIRFQDGVSPKLYGALYYQNPKKNLYCMSLPNGRFASFSDSKIGRLRNIVQELCYPIQECKP